MWLGTARVGTSILVVLLIQIILPLLFMAVPRVLRMALKGPLVALLLLICFRSIRAK